MDKWELMMRKRVISVAVSLGWENSRKLGVEFESDAALDYLDDEVLAPQRSAW